MLWLMVVTFQDKAAPVFKIFFFWMGLKFTSLKLSLGPSAAIWNSLISPKKVFVHVVPGPWQPIKVPIWVGVCAL